MHGSRRGTTALTALGLALALAGGHDRRLLVRQDLVRSQQVRGTGEEVRNDQDRLPAKARRSAVLRRRGQRREEGGGDARQRQDRCRRPGHGLQQGDQRDDDRGRPARRRHRDRRAGSEDRAAGHRRGQQRQHPDRRLRRPDPERRRQLRGVRRIRQRADGHIGRAGGRQAVQAGRLDGVGHQDSGCVQARSVRLPVAGAGRGAGLQVRCRRFAADRQARYRQLRHRRPEQGRCGADREPRASSTGSSGDATTRARPAS